MDAFIRLISALILTVALLSSSQSTELRGSGRRAVDRLGERRMLNVSVKDAFREEAKPRTVLPVLQTLSAESAALPAVLRSDETKETTISGGLSIRNATDYWVDVPGIVSDGTDITLPADSPQILIIHTHSSEAYTQAGLDRYEPSDSYRTENTEFNVVRIGDELTAIYEEAGLRVIHDRGIYDYPSYTGSYTRSGEAIGRYLSDYPGIGIVIDLHRDALGSDGVVYKTMAEEDGVVSSQVMLLVGTDASGLEHPDWRRNLALALYLQNTVNLVNPTLMRPVELVRERYNQQLCPGALILEVGSNGNTLQEALAAIRMFGHSSAPALLSLVEGDAAEPFEEEIESTDG